MERAKKRAPHSVLRRLGEGDYAGRSRGGRREAGFEAGEANVTHCTRTVLVILKITALPTPQRLGEETQCFREKNRFTSPSAVRVLMGSAGRKAYEQTHCIPRSETLGNPDFSPAPHSSSGRWRTGQRTQRSLLWRSPASRSHCRRHQGLDTILSPLPHDFLLPKATFSPEFPNLAPTLKILLIALPMSAYSLHLILGIAKLKTIYQTHRRCQYPVK